MSATALAAPAPDASAARMPPPPLDVRAEQARAPICVHLTPFAPGCEKLGIGSPRRNATFYGKTLAQVLRATLRRCGLAPGAVRVEAEVCGDVNLLAPAPPELLGLQSADPAVPVPYAIIWDGASAADVAHGLEALRAQGWTPDQAALLQPLIGA